MAAYRPPPMMVAESCGLTNLCRGGTASVFPPQLAFDQHKRVERVLEIAICGSIGCAPILYDPPYSRDKQACVSFAQFPVEIVVGGMPLFLCIREGTGQIAGKNRRSNGARNDTARTKQISNARINVCATNLVESRLKSGVAKYSCYGSPSSTEIVVRANQSARSLLHDKPKSGS